MQRHKQYEGHTYKEEVTFKKFTKNLDKGAQPAWLSDFAFVISITANMTPRMCICLQV